MAGPLILMLKSGSNTGLTCFISVYGTIATRCYLTLTMIMLNVIDKFSGRVGFLGLGIMGSPMAQNLIKAGYDLVHLPNYYC